MKKFKMIKLKDDPFIRKPLKVILNNGRVVSGTQIADNDDKGNFKNTIEILDSKGDIHLIRKDIILKES